MQWIGQGAANTVWPPLANFVAQDDQRLSFPKFLSALHFVLDLLEDQFAHVLAATLRSPWMRPRLKHVLRLQAQFRRLIDNKPISSERIAREGVPIPAAEIIAHHTQWSVLWPPHHWPGASSHRRRTYSQA